MIDYKDLLQAERKINEQIINAHCDGLVRNMNDPKRLLELIEHLRRTFQSVAKVPA